MWTTITGIAAALIVLSLTVGLTSIGADEGLIEAEKQAVVDEAVKLGRADRICGHLTENGVQPSQVLRRTFYQGGSQSPTVRTASTGGQGASQWWTDNKPIYIDHPGDYYNWGYGDQERTKPWSAWIYYIDGDRSKPTMVPQFRIDERGGSATTSSTAQAQVQSYASESKWIYIGDAEVQHPAALMSSIWGGTPACQG